MFKGLERERRKKIDKFRIDCRIGCVDIRIGMGLERVGRRPIDDGQMPLV